MPNPLFVKHVRDRVRAWTSAFETAGEVPHNLLKGRLRELLASTLLVGVLPEGFHLGAGIITDANGAFSAEADLIIYDRQRFPSVMYDEKNGVFPIEACHYVFEIKSTITKDEVDETIVKGRKLRALAGPQPHFALIAYTSDLSKKDELDRYRECDADYKSRPAVNLILVVGRFYGYFDGARWNLWPSCDGEHEVRGFLGGLINTLLVSRQKPYNKVPGYYILP